MDLITKYNVPAPRYTSYPTVPYWETTPSDEQWKEHVRSMFTLSNGEEGISVYLHLPFCESLCTYCACNTRITVNHKIEEPYIATLLKEWDLYLELFDEKPRIREIHLGGGTPTFFSPANLEKLIKGILEKAEKFPGAEFSFEGHPNNTTRGHLVTLHRLGFTRVSFGVQDLDDKVQDAINRVQPFENLVRVVEQARESGYTSINFDLVYGLPFQNLKTIEDTISRVISLRPDRIAFYSYAHVPWLKPGQRKYSEKDLPADTVKRALYEKGLELFRKEGYEDVGMDHFALPGDPLFKAISERTLHRNFMGYTANSTRLMIGLGVSSISDTWTAFAQNVKTVEGYRQQVEKGRIPVFKGHLLTDEDLVLRKHILDIMCRNETTFESEFMKSETFSRIVERLQPLQEDGLMQLTGDHLHITIKGKPFLRNICLCLDARYWKKVPAAATFSTVA